MKNPQKVNRFSKEYFLYPNIMKQKENQFFKYKKEQEEILKKQLKMKSSIINKLEIQNENNLKKLFQLRNFDVNLIPESSNWIPIEYFDNLKYESRTPQEWIEFYRLESGNIMEIKAKVLNKNQQNDTYEWQDVIVKGYNDKTNKWIVQRHQNQYEVKRINLIFGIENKNIFCERFIEAYLERAKKNQKIKYYFYINSMPKNNLQENKNILRNNILQKLTQNIQQKNINKDDQLKTIDDHFNLIQNKIIFDNHAKKQGDEFLKDHELYLLFNKDKKPLNKKGILQLKKNSVRLYYKDKKFEYPATLNFKEKFGLFCIQSIYNENGYLRLLQQIQQINLKIKSQNIFSLSNQDTINFTTFKKLQENSTSTFIGYCRAQWGKKLVQMLDILYEQINIQMKYQESNTNIDRFKNLLIKIDLILQDCLEQCIRKSFTDYIEYFSKRTPTKVEIISPSEVYTYYGNTKIKSNQFNDFRNKNKPLFQIDCRICDTEIQIVENPQNFKNLIIQIFEKTLSELSKFRKIEDQILNKNIESRMQKNIKIPQFLKVKINHQLHNTIQNKFKDKNEWLVRLHEQITNDIQKQINPLLEYKKLLKKEQDILIVDSQNYLLNYFKDNQWQVEDINKKIEEIRSIYKDIKQRYPDELQISCFLLNNQEMKDKIKQEYKKIEKGLTQKIEEKGIMMLTQILQKNKLLKIKMKKRPENIEQLADIRDFLQNNLQDLIKETQIEIKKAQKVFEILEKNQIKIGGDQIKKFWYVYGSCRELIDLKKTVLIELKYQKEAFYDDLKQNQRKFNDDIQFIKQLVLNFTSNNDVKQYESIYEEAQDIKTQIDQLLQKVEYFNKRETLLKKKLTQYHNLEDTSTFFNYFYNFWSIKHQWENQKDSWLFNHWQDIDSEQIKKFIEDGIKELTNVEQYFNQNKSSYQNLLNNTQDLRQQLIKFQDNIQLITSLFQPYLKDRHWDEIMNYSQIKIDSSEFENLNLQLLLKKGFIKVQNFCTQISIKAKKEDELSKQFESIMQKYSTQKIELKIHPKFDGYFDFINLNENQEILQECLNQLELIKKNPFTEFQQEELKNFKQLLVQVKQNVQKMIEFIDKWSQFKEIYKTTDFYKKESQRVDQFRNSDQFYLKLTSMVHQDQKLMKIFDDENIKNELQNQINILDNLLEWNKKEIDEQQIILLIKNQQKLTQDIQNLNQFFHSN